MNKYLLIPLITLLSSFSAAPAFAASGIITVNPSNGSYTDSFTVSVDADGGGENFNAAQATVAVSQNLAIKDVTLGNCNFSFISTPSVTNPSFSGAILGGSSPHCTIYTMTLQPLVTGTGRVSLTNGAIKSYNGGKELLSSLIDGTFSLSPAATLPTSTPALMQNTTASLPAYSLQVKLTDTDNQPVAGVSLTIASPKAGQSAITATTDANGVANFSNVAPGSHEITAQNGNKTIASNIVTASGTNPVIVLGMQEQKHGFSFQWYYLLVLPLLLFIGYLFWQKFHASKEETNWQGQVQ